MISQKLMPPASPNLT